MHPWFCMLFVVSRLLLYLKTKSILWTSYKTMHREKQPLEILQDRLRNCRNFRLHSTWRVISGFSVFCLKKGKMEENNCRDKEPVKLYYPDFFPENFSSFPFFWLFFFVLPQTFCFSRFQHAEPLYPKQNHFILKIIITIFFPKLVSTHTPLFLNLLDHSPSENHLSLPYFLSGPPPSVVSFFSPGALCG